MVHGKKFPVICRIGTAGREIQILYRVGPLHPPGNGVLGPKKLVINSETGLQPFKMSTSYPWQYRTVGYARYTCKLARDVVLVKRKSQAPQEAPPHLGRRLPYGARQNQMRTIKPRNRRATRASLEDDPGCPHCGRRRGPRVPSLSSSGAQSVNQNRFQREAAGPGPTPLCRRSLLAGNAQRLKKANPFNQPAHEALVMAKYSEKGYGFAKLRSNRKFPSNRSASSKCTSRGRL